VLNADPVMERYAQRLLRRSLRRAGAADRSVRQLVVLLLPRELCR
jgi:hypothetical protein